MDHYNHVFFKGVDTGATGPPRQPRAKSVNRDPTSHSCPSVALARSRESVEPLHPFLYWLLCRAGLNPQSYRPRALNRRLQACLRALKTASPDQARSVLERNPQFLSKAISAVLIGVSSFFREPHVFAALEQRVLPRMLTSREQMWIYSAGCAEGQELYSVALVLDELGVLDRCHLLGVDCRAQAVEQAAAGAFAASELEGVAPRWRQRFEWDQSGGRIPARVRAQIHWEKADLGGLAMPNASWDVILFRNVAIYLEPDEAFRVWGHLAARLRPGGVLVTGKAERPPASLGFERIEPCLFQLNPLK